MGWLTDFFRPVNLIFLVLALLGIFASWYFYNKSEKTGQLVVLVDQVQVFDKERLGQLPLRVLDANGRVITDNVFAASVTIWNAGTAEIRKADVRKPFRVVIGSGLPPLDLTATNYTHENINGFQLAPDGHLNWEHFDPGEGIKLRIIYVANSQLDIKLEGSALGLPAVVNRTEAQRAAAKKELAPAGIFSIVIAIAMSIFFAIGGIINLIEWRKSRKWPSLGIGLVLLFVGSSALIAVCIAVIRNVISPTPPF
jgi:hypothetical protein